MIEAAEANGVTLFVAENQAYSARARYLREVVQSGEPIGALTAASLMAGFRSENFGYAGRRDWLTRPEAGGTGTWMLHGIHSMAELRVIFGPGAKAKSRPFTCASTRADSFQRRDIEGTVTGLLTLSSGLAVSIVQSSETRLPDALAGYVLHGERGSIHAGPEQATLYLAAADSSSPQTIAYPQSPLSTYAQEIQAFVEAVQHGEGGLTDGRSERAHARHCAGGLRIHREWPARPPAREVW